MSLFCSSSRTVFSRQKWDISPSTIYIKIKIFANDHSGCGAWLLMNGDDARHPLPGSGLSVGYWVQTRTSSGSRVGPGPCTDYDFLGEKIFKCFPLKGGIRGSCNLKGQLCK